VPALAPPAEISRSRQALELLKALGRGGWRVGRTRRFGGGFRLQAWRGADEYLEAEGDDLWEAADSLFRQYHYGGKTPKGRS
jgi:hypothetical protein